MSTSARHEMRLSERLDSTSRRRVVVVVGLAMAVSAILSFAWFNQDWPVPAGGGRPSGVLISRIYDPPTRPLERAMNEGDGQIFALQASDPLIRRTDLFGSEVPGHHAYRWERPLYGYLGWAFSLGSSDRVPEGLVVLSICSAALLAGVVAREIESRRGRAVLALLVVMSPGVVTNLWLIGPESLGAALVLLGARRWGLRTGSGWDAVALLGLAALCRETMLLAPAALAIHAQLRRSQDGGRWWVPRRDALRMSVACVPLLTWIGFLRLHIGVFPEPSNETLISVVPFRGLVSAIDSWSTMDMLAAMVVLIPTIVLLLRLRRFPDDHLRPIAWAFAGFAPFVGVTMWSDDAKIGRLLLPLTAIAVVHLGQWVGEQGRSKEGTSAAGLVVGTRSAREPVDA